jgi:glutaredoxin
MASRFIVYGRESCPWCIRANEYLKILRQDSVFLNFEKDRGFLEEVKSYYNWRTVPVILENNLNTGKVTFVGGYDSLKERFPESWKMI